MTKKKKNKLTVCLDFGFYRDEMFALATKKPLSMKISVETRGGGGLKQILKTRNYCSVNSIYFLN